ncbi:MAG: CDP-glycerol glycerophosphotransferase family protein, partial [Lachnospiraceae bacterium]|nr:CDP-glycerol glycerophosphotransferase family protein [Lachnospiraceae bacterium]
QYHKTAKKQVSKENQAREKQDYKRFFKYGYKQIVFYSEKNGFYKYFKNVIEFILAKTDIVIHYITGDPNDEVFKLTSDRFQTYYIGENKFIVLMMKLEADIMVMTTPDLQTYHIKKSLVQDNIEYIYMDHAMGDVNLSYRKHALDNFSTIFVPNELTEREIRAQEKTYDLKAKNIVRTGYGLIDDMISQYKPEERDADKIPEILIAPSWQQDNLIDMCIDEILDQILGKGYHVILRPHPQYVRHFEEKLNSIKEKYASHEDFELQMDFSSNKTVFDADVLMTDWSGIAYEYSFTTLRPTLYINTPMKIMNPDYEEIGIEPFDITVRDEIGISVDTDKLSDLASAVDRLLNDEVYSPESIASIREKYLFNIGKSGEVGARYIINKLIEYSKA